VLASIAIRNGEVYALITYQVSTDGRTLTARSRGRSRRWLSTTAI